MTAVTAARPGRGKDIGVLVLLLVLCFAAGGLGAIATEPNIPTWYAGLNEPWFNPPNGIFAPVWSILYALMAIAGWIAWRQPAADTTRRWRRLVPFFVQLALNTGWSFAFFGAHSPFGGLLVIALLILAILWTGVIFARASLGAGLLLLPYLAWVLFAAALNTAIVMLN